MAFGALLMLLLVSGAEVQGQNHDGDTILVETQMNLSSLGALEGSGHLSITFEGAAATNLRPAVFNKYDSNSDTVLNAGEVRVFLRDMGRALNGSTYWGVTIEITTDFGNMSDEDVRSHTDGLIWSDWASEESFSIAMDMSCSGQGFSKVIFVTESAVDTFVGSVADVLEYEFTGQLSLRHRVLLTGIGSISGLVLDSGTLNEFRHPLGTIIWYSSDIEVTDEGTATAAETVTYEEFTVLESAQIGFVVVLIGSMMVLRMPATRFDKYRMLHPKKYRKYAKPRRSVRISAVASAASLWVVYLFPSILTVFNPEVIIYTVYLFMLVPTVVLAEHFYSKGVYDRCSLDIPDELILEIKHAVVEVEESKEAMCEVCARPIDAPSELHVCNECGAQMHEACGERAQTCPGCGEILFSHLTRSIQCKSCGESFLFSGEEDEYAIQCGKCGAFQEEVKQGRNYLIVDRDPRNAYMMLRAMGLSERPAMVLTAEFPGKIRGEYDLGDDFDVKWLSDSTTDIDNVNPKDLEGDAMETTSTFLMTTKRAGLLLDGIEMMIEMNGFDRTLAFIKRVNDLAAIHSASVLLTVDKLAVSEDEYKSISDEFDEIHDYY